MTNCISMRTWKTYLLLHSFSLPDSLCVELCTKAHHYFLLSFQHSCWNTILLSIPCDSMHFTTESFYLNVGRPRALLSVLVSLESRPSTYLSNPPSWNFTVSVQTYGLDTPTSFRVSTFCVLSFLRFAWMLLRNLISVAWVLFQSLSVKTRLLKHTSKLHRGSSYTQVVHLCPTLCV